MKLTAPEELTAALFTGSPAGRRIGPGQFFLGLENAFQGVGFYLGQIAVTQRTLAVFIAQTAQYGTCRDEPACLDHFADLFVFFLVKFGIFQKFPAQPVFNVIKGVLQQPALAITDLVFF
jgi:hypothetical protein